MGLASLFTLLYALFVSSFPEVISDSPRSPKHLSHTFFDVEQERCSRAQGNCTSPYSILMAGKPCVKN